MRTITIYILLALFSSILPMSAQNRVEGKKLIDEAYSAYEKDDFAKAIQLYEQAAATEGTSSELFYNMGNTYYRLGNMGKSVLYYEKALQINPGNEDARTNLDFVNDKLQLKIDRGTTFFSDTIGNFVKRTSSNVWGWIGIISFVLFILSILLYVFSEVIALRKIGFFGGGVLLIISVIANVCAFYTHANVVSHNYAIVTIPSSTLSTSPRVPKDKTEEAFTLNEGTKVEILDSIQSVATPSDNKTVWYDVKADEQHRAWINAQDVERI